MRVDVDICALIGGIYEAAIAPERWPEVLDRIGDCFDGCKAALTTDDFDAEAGFSLYYTDRRIDPEDIETFKREFGGNRETHSGAPFYPLFPLASPIRRTAFQCDAEFTAAEMYQRWMRPMGIFYISVTKLMTTPHGAVLLQVGRDRAGGDFGGDEIELIAHLAPHLRHAVQMQTRLALAEARQSTLDGLPWGVLVVDVAGRILSRNTAAEELLAEGDGLIAAHGHLAAAWPAQTRALLTAVRQAFGAADGDALPPDALSLPRLSGRRPLEVLVVPLRQAARPGLPPAVALFVGDPERRIEPAGHVLQRLYGLSCAEAKLTLALLDGSGLSDAADRLGIGLATAKTQLQAVFAKTGTRRQTQLLSLLLKGPTALGAATATDRRPHRA